MFSPPDATFAAHNNNKCQRIRYAAVISPRYRLFAAFAFIAAAAIRELSLLLYFRHFFRFDAAGAIDARCAEAQRM